MINIQELLSEAVLYHDYRTGSFKDLSGNGNDGIPTGLFFTGDGIICNASGDNVGVADSPELQLTEGTLIVLADFSTLTSSVEKRFISKRDAGGTNYDLRAVDTGVTLYDGTNSRFLAVTTNGLRYIGVNFKDGEVAEGFTDGTSAGNFSGVSAISVDDAPIQICNGSVNPASYFDSNTKAALIFPRKLTATEHSALYGYLDSLHFDKKVKTISNANIVVKQETGLVAGYNMKPEGGVIVDQSENGLDLNLSNSYTTSETPFGVAGVFNGVDSKCESTSSISLGDDNLTLSAIINTSVSGTNQTIINAGNTIYLRINNINGYARAVLIGADATVTEVYGSSVDLTDGLYHLIVITVDKSGNATLYVDGVAGTPVDISGVGSLRTGIVNVGTRAGIEYFNGKIISPKIYNELKSADWINQEYALMKQALFKTESGVYESVDNQTEVLENSPFKVDSGAFKITREDINGVENKVIECVTSGVCYIPTAEFKQTPTESAYGEWEFNYYKGSSSGTGYIGIINDVCGGVASGDGYFIYARNIGRIDLWRRGSAGDSVLMNTDNNQLPLDEYVKFNLERTTDGEFTLRINDQLVTVVGGANPVTNTSYTESKYMVVEMVAGDKIAYAPNSIKKYLTT